MKKFLAITIFTSLLASSAFAGENDFYIGAELGMGSLPTKTKSFDYDEPDEKHFLKNNNHTIGALSVGYQLNDDLRFDLKFTNHFGANAKFADDTKKHHNKYKISSLTLNSYYNIIDFNFGKIFVGGGAGFAFASSKSTYNQGAGADATLNAKRKTNFAYRLTVGSTFDLNEKVSLDLSYSFNNYGKTKSLLNANGDELSNASMRNHSFLAGVRVSL